MESTPLDLPLKDIHLPQDISWWPLSIGWWIIIAALVLGLFAYCVCRYLTKPTLKKSASHELSNIEKKFNDNQDAILCLKELSVFLRRVSISKDSPQKVAGLTGDKWLNHLDSSLKEPEFNSPTGQILIKGPYCGRVERGSVIELLKLCHKWVERL